MFRQIEHSADLAVIVEAPTREELFREALNAARSLLVTDATKKSAELPQADRDSRLIVASGFDDEERLVGLLNELLHLIQYERWLPVRVDDLELDGDRVQARLAGLSGGARMPRLIREVKAATYHDLHITRGKVWSVRIVFDV